MNSLQTQTTATTLSHYVTTPGLWRDSPLYLTEINERSHTDASGLIFFVKAPGLRSIL